MTGKRVGIALVGCGSNGQIHADGLAKLVADGDIRAVAAVDPSPGALDAANRNCAFETRGSDLALAVDNPVVDAVLVSGPTATHAVTIEAAITAGKAVMSEKPLAPDFATVESLVDLVVTSGLVGQVGFQSRFNPMFTYLKRVVDERIFGLPLGYMLREDQFWPTGSVVAGHSSWRSDPELAGGGALLEHTIHGCDLLAWLFGPAATVSARTRSVFGFGVEDVATAQVAHENEVVGTITTAFNGVEGREERRLEIFFEQATVEITGDFVIGATEDSFVIHHPRAEPERPDLGALRRELFTSYGVVRDDFIFYQYVADRAFVHAVREGRPASPDFDDAWRAHAIVEAAYRSAAAAGAPTAVPQRTSLTQR
jgi:UDP-N-acetyl-2-amino-2-deoxyglucuronate dehydrogenase